MKITYDIRDLFKEILDISDGEFSWNEDYIEFRNKKVNKYKFMNLVKLYFREEYQINSYVTKIGASCKIFYKEEEIKTFNDSNELQCLIYAGIYIMERNSNGF
jgi:hypothetical protein